MQQWDFIPSAARKWQNFTGCGRESRKNYKR